MDIRKKLVNCKLIKLEALSLRKSYIDDLQMVEQLKAVDHTASEKIQHGCNEMLNKIESLIAEYKSIENAISTVPGEMGKILMMYYIEVKNDDRIAKNLGIGKSEVIKHRNKGIQWLENHCGELVTE